MSNKNENFDSMPVGKLLLKLAIPSIIAQIINMLYNIVDRIFLGHVPGAGVSFLAGIGITMPLINIIIAFANLVGNGGAPLAAIALGKKNEEEANDILCNSFMLLLIQSVILTVICQLFAEEFLLFLGADAKTLPYAERYFRIYAMGTIFVQMDLGLNMFLITQGFNKISMRNTFIGAGINIILDPIFLFVFNMGIEGAAFATILSQCVTAVLVIAFLLGKKSKLHLHFVRLRRNIIKQIVGLGISTFFMGVTESIVQSVYYGQLLVYGNQSYVAAMTIIYTLNQIIMKPIFGLGQGAQPIISYSYGAGNIDRLKEAIRRLLLWGTLSSICGVMILEIFPGSFLRIFTVDTAVLTVGISGLRLFVFGRLLTGIQLGLQETFRAVGYGKAAIFNAAMRKLVLIIPLAYIIPGVFRLGTTGVFLAESIADILAMLVTTCSFMILKNKIYAGAADNRRKLQ